MRGANALFDWPDFSAEAPSRAAAGDPPAPAPDAPETDDRYTEGLRDGEARAQEAARGEADRECARLAETLRAALRGAQADLEAAQRRYDGAVREGARALLAGFAGRLAPARETEIIDALLARFRDFAGAPADAAIEISAAVDEETTARLREQFAQSPAAPIRTAPDLAPGEARIVWSGGALAYDRTAIDDVIEDAIDRALDAAAPNSPDAPNSPGAPLKGSST